MRKLVLGTLASLLAVLMVATAAFAAVTFDPGTGTGFAGKGDVQLIFGWNNKQLQDNANSVQFRVYSVSETTWECSRPHPTQDREIIQQRSTETTTQGLLVKIARENSKGKDGAITGFFLQGYNGAPTIINEGDGEVGSCPASPSGFTFVEGSEETTESTGGLQVSAGGDWVNLQ